VRRWVEEPLTAVILLILDDVKARRSTPARRRAFLFADNSGFSAALPPFVVSLNGALLRGDAKRTLFFCALVGDLVGDSDGDGAEKDCDRAALITVAPSEACHACGLLFSSTYIINTYTCVIRLVRAWVDEIQELTIATVMQQSAAFQALEL